MKAKHADTKFVPIEYLPSRHVQHTRVIQGRQLEQGRSQRFYPNWTAELISEQRHRLALTQRLQHPAHVVIRRIKAIDQGNADDRRQGRQFRQ